jgi:hypothetical protein
VRNAAQHLARPTHTTRPRSRRFESRHKPSASHHGSLPPCCVSLLPVSQKNDDSMLYNVTGIVAVLSILLANALGTSFATFRRLEVGRGG